MEKSSDRIILKSKEIMRSRGRGTGRFLTCEFDRTTWDLKRNGHWVKRLAQQEVTVLELLTSEPQSVVSTEAMGNRLWGKGKWGDQRIHDLIHRLREALGDSPEQQVFIETLAGRRYRFVGTITTASEVLPPEPEPTVAATPVASAVTNLADSVNMATIESSASPAVFAGEQKATGAESFRHRLRGRSVWVVLLVGFIAGIVYLPARVWQQEPPFRPPRKLLSNPAERKIVTVAISPDGKYFAHAETASDTETASAYVTAVDSGDLRDLQVNTGELPLSISWFPDSTRLLMVSSDPGGQDTTLRAMSILNGRVTGRPIQKDVGEASVSPDGARIAYTNRKGTALYIQQLGTDERRRLLDGGEGEAFRSVSWASAESIVIGRVRFGDSSYTVTIELVNAQTGVTTTLATDARVRSGCALPGGGLIFSTIDSDSSALFSASIDLANGKLRSSPRSIQRMPQTAIYMLSASADGQRIVYLQGPYQADAFTVDLPSPLGLISSPRRLTVDDSNDVPTAWRPDGEAILFHSDRRGTWEIFAQNVGQNRAEAIVTGADDYKGARFTSDGKWLLFYANPRPSKSTAPVVARAQSFISNRRIMRMSAAGGSWKSLMSGRGLSFRCPAKVPYCVVCEPGVTGLTFSTLDPESGKKTKLTSVRSIGPPYWDISPEGEELAIASSRNGDGVIRRINLRDGSPREVVVKGRPDIQSMDWAPNGNGWFVSSRWTHGADLLFVAVDGKETVLRRQFIGFETWGLPFRDGKRFAFLEWSSSGSPWLLTK